MGLPFKRDPETGSGEQDGRSLSAPMRTKIVLAAWRACQGAL